MVILCCMILCCNVRHQSLASQGRTLRCSCSSRLAASSASTAPMRQQKAARWASVTMACCEASCSSSEPCCPAAWAAAALRAVPPCRCAPCAHHWPCRQQLVLQACCACHAGAEELQLRELLCCTIYRVALALWPLYLCLPLTTGGTPRSCG